MQMTHRESFRGQKYPIPLQILIAEDEVMVALSMSDLLEDEGYKVTIAGDGAKALAAARQIGDDLSVLLTDLNMPNVSGEELIRILRAERPGLPMIVITGSPPLGGLEDLRGSDKNGQPFALLHKPVDYGELIATLLLALA